MGDVLFLALLVLGMAFAGFIGGIIVTIEYYESRGIYLEELGG